MPEQLPIAGPMLGAALTVVGLLVSWIVWRRRGVASGMRGVAWSLLPLAAGLMGLMETLWRFVGDLVKFFTGLILNPVVWAGAAVAALAVVLWVVSGVLRARGVGTTPRKGGSKATRTKDASAAAGAGVDTAPAIGASASPATHADSSGTSKKKAGAEDDMSDIEDLLRKHGIE